MRVSGRISSEDRPHKARKSASRERARRLQRLREYRRLLVHEYASGTAAQVHEAARIVADELPPFCRAYLEWVRNGFQPRD